MVGFEQDPSVIVISKRNVFLLSAGWCLRGLRERATLDPVEKYASTVWRWRRCVSSVEEVRFASRFPLQAGEGEGASNGFHCGDWCRLLGWGRVEEQKAKLKTGD